MYDYLILEVHMKKLCLCIFFLSNISFAATKTVLVDLKSSSDTSKKHCYYESEINLGAADKSTPFQVFFNDGRSHRFNADRTFTFREDIEEHYSIVLRNNNLFLKLWESIDIDAKTCPPFAEFIVIN